MISLETYILFVAPFIMGAGGLVIYLVAMWFIRSHDRRPAE